MTLTMEVHEAVRDRDGLLIYKLLAASGMLYHGEPYLPTAYAIAEPYHWRSYCPVAKPKEKDELIDWRVTPTCFGHGSYGNVCEVCRESDYDGPIIHKDGCGKVAEQLRELRERSDA